LKRGRPKKADNKKKEAKLIEVPKRGRGRPPKVKPKVKVTTAPEPVKRKRGRPPKLKTPLPVPAAKKDKLAAFRKPIKVERKAKKVKDQSLNLSPDDQKIADHPLYPAVKWLMVNMPSCEDEYIKKMARKVGTTPLNMTMEHLLGYFQIKGSDIGQTLKTQHKPV
jgi:hypothetical protein